MTEQIACPCGRESPYVSCCGPLHEGGAAPTAERLMRSRYSAFTLSNERYLLDTWHPSTRPATMDLDLEIEWSRLAIENTVAGGPFDTAGEVTFTAIARTLQGRLEQRERSRFVRDQDGRWCYIDGDSL